MVFRAAAAAGAVIVVLAARCAVPPSPAQPTQPGPDPSGNATPPPTAPAAPATAASKIAFVREDASGLPGMYYGSMAAADFDGDGKVDLLFAGNFDTVYDSGRHGEAERTRLIDRIRLFKNVSTRGGPIRFELSQERKDFAGARGSLAVTGDFDGDHRPDFAVEVRNGDDIAAWLNRGNFIFEKRVLERGFGNKSNSLGMVATDVDRDGKDDLVFNSDGSGSGSGLWYKWTGTRFEPQQRKYPHQITYGGTIAAGDLDGDGYPELAVGGNSRAPFGDHVCENLMIGQTVHNTRGTFDMAPMVILGNFGLREDPSRRSDTTSCHGMDNASMAIADLDRDGKNDVVIAGSATGFAGPPGVNGQQYDFVVLYNDGTGRDFETYEHTGPQDSDGTSNGGAANVDFPSIAIGDLDGDGDPDVFVQGHRRDFMARYDVNGDGTDKDNPYVFEDLLFENDGGRSLRAVPLEAYLPRHDDTLPRELGFLVGRPKFVGEGGQAIADFDGDGLADLVFCGAERPFHTNGANSRDYNDATTLKTYVLRSRRGP